MTWWEALVLGTVQGLTEFFPVSSSGHLVMLQTWLGISVEGIAFEIVVHVATLVSVLIVYRAKIISLLAGTVRRGEESSWPYIFRLGVASVPALLAYLAFSDWIEQRFDDPAFAGTMLLVTGCFLWSTRWSRERRPGLARDSLPIVISALAALYFGTLIPFVAVLGSLALLMGVARLTAAAEWKLEPSWGAAIGMGIAQSFALFPGISRSGSTVVTGLWRRIDGVVAAEFSFLMAVIAIGGSALLTAPEILNQREAIGALPLVVGFVASAVAGVVAIRFFVALLRRQSFHHFAWYCWVVGILFLSYVGGGA